MDKKKFGVLLVIIAGLLLGGCGYYFPHVYDGPTKNIYMAKWKNRTNKLGLDAKIYQSLSRWFQKSEAINLTKKKEGADLILAGEIVYIDLPSIAWDGNSSTTDVKVKLGLRYVLKDIDSGEILWEIPRKVWTEDYPSQTVNATIEEEALSQIIDDLSEYIYLGTLKKIRSQNAAVQTTK